MKPTKPQDSKRCQTLEMFTTSNSWAIPKTQPAGRKSMIQVKLQKLQSSKMGCAYFLLFSCVLVYTRSSKKRLNHISNKIRVLLYSHPKPGTKTYPNPQALRRSPTEASAPAAVPPNQLLDAGWPKRSENFWPNQR